MGTAIEDQQLGCLCVGGELLTVALSGFIYYLDPENPAKPKRVLKGHNRPIMAAAFAKGYIYTADSEGNTSEFRVLFGFVNNCSVKAIVAQNF